MLHNQALVSVQQTIRKENFVDTTKAPHLQDARHAHLRVVLNNSLRLHYDTHDSWEIDEEYLSGCDFYFKRSFLPQKLKDCDSNKIYPLGLIYPVYATGLDKFAVERSVVFGKTKNKARSFIHSLAIFDRWDAAPFVPRVHLIQSLPDYAAPPRILFMVQAWDPNEPGLTKEKSEEREYINSTRANCIQLLREEFENNFYGGFGHTSFAMKNYKSLLISDANLSSKRNYIKMLKQYPICVATMGLHGSTGSKFGEYVAFSKAILSEKLNYQVPGKLTEGNNYLEFSTPEECVKKAYELVSNQELRFHMMKSNMEYYSSSLRPDALVLDTLRIALSDPKV